MLMDLPFRGFIALASSPLAPTGMGLGVLLGSWMFLKPIEQCADYFILNLCNEYVYVDRLAGLEWAGLLEFNIGRLFMVCMMSIVGLIIGEFVGGAWNIIKYHRHQ
jgi:hypothetical protein